MLFLASISDCKPLKKEKNYVRRYQWLPWSVPEWSHMQGECRFLFYFNFFSLFYACSCAKLRHACGAECRWQLWVRFLGSFRFPAEHKQFALILSKRQWMCFPVMIPFIVSLCSVLFCLECSWAARLVGPCLKMNFINEGELYGVTTHS